MKTWLKKSIVAGLCLVSMAAFTGCGGEKQTATNDKPAGYPVSWTETLDGQEVKQSVEKAPAHAISMSQATTEMMLALGLEDKMAGTAMKEEEIYPPLQAAYDKVKVLSDKWPSYETFMDTVFEDMQKLGEIFGVNDKADAWVKSEKDKLASVQGKIEKLPKKKIFVYDASDGKPFTAFKGYTTNILKLIGAENVMENAGVDNTWAAVSWENVVAADPEYIIIADYSNGVRNDDDFQQKVAAIKGNPQLANVTAVKENHFVKVKLSEITPGVRTVDALVRMAEEIHGISVK